MAILVVVAHHVVAFQVPTMRSTLVPGGFLGVDLFMVLSGYLITDILVGEVAHPGWGARFYRRRAVRLLPALVALLAVVSALTLVGALSSPDTLLGSVLAALLYSFNYVSMLGVTKSPYLGHLWSLAVEEQFYLAWPLLLAVVTARRARATLAMSLAVAIIAIRARGLWAGVSTDALYVMTLTHADALLVGAMLVVMPALRTWLARLAPLAALAFGAAVLFAQPYARFLFSWGFVAAAVVCGSMVAGVVEGRWVPRWLTSRPLRTTGLVSYGLYLWHFPVCIWVAIDLMWFGAGGALVAVAVSAAATVASWFLVERTTSRWREPSRGRRAERAPAVVT